MRWCWVPWCSGWVPQGKDSMELMQNLVSRIIAIIKTTVCEAKVAAATRKMSIFTRLVYLSGNSRFIVLVLISRDLANLLSRFDLCHSDLTVILYISRRSWIVCATMADHPVTAPLPAKPETSQDASSTASSAEEVDLLSHGFGVLSVADSVVSKKVSFGSCNLILF